MEETHESGGVDPPYNEGPAATKGGQGASEMKELTPVDLEDAERIIVNHVQKEHFLPELMELTAGREVGALCQSFGTYEPFMEDGLIRMRGRLTNSNLDWTSKHPLILPDKDKVTDLITTDLHERVGHEGR